MKRFFSLVLAGIIGGAFTFGLMQLTQDNEKTRSPAPYYARQTNYLNAAPVNTAPFDFTEAARRSTQAVVHISAKESKEKAANRAPQNDPFRFFFGDDFGGFPFGNPGPRQGTGSGVIYLDNGYIITNNHVVEFADELEVTLYDNRKFKAEVVGTYPKTDLAVIKIEANNLPTLEIADSDEAQVGEWVLAVGNPLNLTSTVTAGIISAKGRDINIIEGADAIESFIQTDAAVNPGNSGGALVDAQGRLLGINTAISTQTGFFEGYSFAIPSNIVTKIADDIIEYGSYQRAYLGVGIAPLDDAYAHKLGLNFSQGVVVESIEDGGSAQYAGVLPKDVIIAANGRAIKSIPELQETVSQAKVGDQIDLVVYREGKNLEVPVVLRSK
ncbi:MAG: trypsin-like peptidase domain-containing protein [Saprospirales bacterium]|nr:trypsin-like peptidase domain-containing protein [Saprospirales bacterium]